MGAIRGLQGALGPREGLAGNQMAPDRPPAAGERASKVLEGGLPFRFLFNLPLWAQSLSAQKSPSPPPSPPRGQMSCLVASNLDGQSPAQPRRSVFSWGPLWPHTGPREPPPECPSQPPVPGPPCSVILGAEAGPGLQELSGRQPHGKLITHPGPSLSQRKENGNHGCFREPSCRSWLHLPWAGARPPLHTHARTHARTQALGEPRTEQSLPHVPSSRDKTAKGRADPALCQGNKAWLPHRGTRSGPDTSLAGGPPYVYMCVHA